MLHLQHSRNNWIQGIFLRLVRGPWLPWPSIRVSGLESGCGSPCCRARSESLPERTRARNWVVNALTKARSQPCGPVRVGLQPALYVPNCVPTGLLSPQRIPFSLAYKASSMGLATLRSPPRLGWWSRLGAPCTTVPFGCRSKLQFFNPASTMKVTFHFLADTGIYSQWVPNSENEVL